MSPGAPQAFYKFNHITGMQEHCEVPSSNCPPSASSSAPAALAEMSLTFEHSLAYVMAMNTEEGWRQHMDAASKRLEKVLQRMTKTGSYLCIVCGDNGIERRARDHICSHSHWRAVLGELNRGTLEYGKTGRGGK